MRLTDEQREAVRIQAEHDQETAALDETQLEVMPRLEELQAILKSIRVKVLEPEMEQGAERIDITFSPDLLADLLRLAHFGTVGMARRARGEWR